MSTHEKTRKSYKEHASSYYEDEGKGKPLIDYAAVRKLLPDLQGTSVLSIGCGAGLELLALRELGAREVFANEPSPFLLAKAKENAPFVSFVEGDIESLSLADKSVDFIYSAHVLHYLKDWDKALEECKRVLKEGGSLIVTLHHPLDWGLIPAENGERHLGYKQGFEPLGNYLETREIEATWYEGFDVVFYSRSIATSTDEFLKRGWTLTGLSEATIKENSPLPLYFALGFRC